MFNMFVWIPDFKVKERKPDKDLLFRGQVVEQLTHATEVGGSHPAESSSCDSSDLAGRCIVTSFRAIDEVPYAI